MQMFTSYPARDGEESGNLGIMRPGGSTVCWPRLQPD